MGDLSGKSKLIQPLGRLTDTALSSISSHHTPDVDDVAVIEAGCDPKYNDITRQSDKSVSDTTDTDDALNLCRLIVMIEV